MLAASSAHLVDEMGETLLKRFDGRIFVVGATWAFEKAQQQYAGAALLANAQSNSAQHNAKGCLALAFPFPVVNVQLAQAALTAIGCGDDSDGWSAIACHGSTGRDRSLPTPD